MGVVKTFLQVFACLVSVSQFVNRCQITAANRFFTLSFGSQRFRLCSFKHADQSHELMPCGGSPGKCLADIRSHLLKSVLCLQNSPLEHGMKLADCILAICIIHFILSTAIRKCLNTCWFHSGCICILRRIHRR